MIRVYGYDKCSTCKKANKWLEERGIEHEVITIKESPPSDAELITMLDAKEGELRKLCNTSGMDYRAQGLKDKLPSLSQAEVFALLQSNGMLVKRPFLVGDGIALTGFREKEWVEAFD